MSQNNLMIPQIFDGLKVISNESMEFDDPQVFDYPKAELDQREDGANTSVQTFILAVLFLDTQVLFFSHFAVKMDI